MMHKKQFIFVALILINSPLVFALPLQYHPASEVTAGTFDSGNYTFPDSVIVTDLICIGTNCVNTLTGGGGGSEWSTYTATSNVNLGGKYNITNSWQGRGVVGTSSTADGVAGITYAAGKSAVYGWANNTQAYSGYFEGGKGFIVDGDVGIGTTSPSTRLEVLGTLNVTGGSAIVQGLYVDPSGNVGVGARNIPYKFAVVKDDGYAAGEHYIATFTKTVGGTGIVLGYRGDGSDSAGSAGLVRATNNRPLVLGTSGTTQAMTVLDNGNVGIGTTVPVGKLHVEMTASTDSSAPRIFSTGMTSGQYSELLIGESHANYKLGIIRYENGAGVAANSKLKLFNGGDPSDDLGITIVGGGNVGIGTASPSQKLEVAGTIYSTSGGFKFPDGTTQTTAASASKIVQVVNYQTGAVSTGTLRIPFDDTAPQNTEGDEYISSTITPSNSANKLKIDVVIVLANTANGNKMTAALFQDSNANAVAAASHMQPIAPDKPVTITFSHYMAAGTTSATTFKVRAGGQDAGTTTFNGISSGRIFGGVMASSITVTEITA